MADNIQEKPGYRAPKEHAFLHKALHIIRMAYFTITMIVLIRRQTDSLSSELMGLERIGQHVWKDKFSPLISVS